jgi:iron complex outermembrane receptor protein
MPRQLKVKSALIACVCAIAFAAQAMADTPREINVPAGELATALESLQKQTGLELVFRPDELKSFRTAGLKGAYPPQEAIRLLLKGTPLELRTDPSGAMLIALPRAKNPSDRSPASGKEEGHGASDGFRLAQAPQGTPESDSSVDKQKENEPVSQKNPVVLEEIVVTGTHIHGEAPVGSALKVYTREEIDQSGASTVEQFARTMVENFSGVDTIANANSNAGFARFASANANVFEGAGFNLHGLGPSATLTLLNGQRLASAGVDGSITDISQIPLSAIDHIEVLTDGASAVYGADAVAGVVNIITRKDFEGAETGLRYGAATDGGANERAASQLLGHSWGSGNVLLSYEYDKQGGLDASDRDYIPPRGGPDLLIPQSKRNSVFLSGSQDLGAETNISGNAIYSDRSFFNENIETGPAISLFEAGILAGYVRQYGATTTVDKALFNDWHASLTVNYSKVQQYDNLTDNLAIGSFTENIPFTNSVDSDVRELDLLANGSLFSLPGGPVKTAFGTSLRGEGFDASETEKGKIAGTANVSSLTRRVASAYGELLIPLAGESNAIQGARRLEFSASGRYDHYSDFGSSTNPKLGLLWEPVQGVDVRSSYGKSFRAPELSQLGSPVVAQTEDYPDRMSSTGVTDTLSIGGGNPKLRPETSKSFTAGFDLKPQQLPDFKLAATYFHIEFNNQISTPPSVGEDFLNDPTLASFVTRSPSPAEVLNYFNSPGFEGDNVHHGAAGVDAIYDGQYTNIAGTTESGVDVTASYGVPTSFGHFGFSANIDRLIEDKFQAVPTEPSFELLNTFGEPAKWKARGNVSWASRGFSAVATVNYVSSYENTLFTPAQRVDSWTTGDLYFGYNSGETAPFYMLKNLKIALSIQNFTNRRPPYVQIPASDLEPGETFIPYDAANASPVGRLIALQLTKHW